MKVVVLAIAALLAVTGAGAAPIEGWRQNGAPAPAQPNLASQGDFGALQISTTDDKKLISDWLKPTPGAYLSTTSKTVRNQPIYVFIVFRGCRPDQAGNCNVTAEFDTFDPSGKPYDTSKNARVWVGRPPPPGYNLQLSEAALGLLIEDKDPIGPYRVVATVTDNVAGISLKTEQVLTVGNAK